MRNTTIRSSLASMRNSRIVGYVRFCFGVLRTAYGHEKSRQSRRYKLMTLGSRIARWANIAFGSITSLGLIYAYLKYVFPLISKRSWSIIFLSVFVLFLLFLIEAIKRFHERTVIKS